MPRPRMGSLVPRILSRVRERTLGTRLGQWDISTIGEAIEQAGVNDWKQALVHMGTDSASV